VEEGQRRNVLGIFKREAVPNLFIQTWVILL
jgi:hypothetical protein